MDTLDGVGHGTALAGRYRLEERLQSSQTSAFWRAVDQTLDRAVGVRVLVGDTAEDTLDAARRAAMVEDPRLLRVLDVGTQERTPGGPVTYVVSEYVDGSSLADLLAGGPLPAEEVRALVGEAARGLEHARSNGLHHRRIGPTSLLRTPSGAVKVAGLAVDAAAEGVGDVSSAQAAREDAVSLVAVLYAGLTGRWPFGDSSGLMAAPVVSGRPAPPADVIGGVPNDLDTLCSVTFGPHDDGPRNPGELAEQLAPWGPRRAGATSHGGAGSGSSSGSASRSGHASRPGSRSSSGSSARSGANDDTQAMRPAGRFPGRLSSGATAAGGHAAVGGATAAGSAGAGREASSAGTAASGDEPTATRALPVVPPSEAARGAAQAPERAEPTRQEGPAQAPARSRSESSQHEASRPGPRHPEASHPKTKQPEARQPAVGVGAAVPAGAAAGSGAAAHPAADAGRSQAGWSDPLGAGTPVGPDDDLEGSGGRNQSRVVLAVVAVVVVIGLVLAVNALLNIGQGGPTAAPTETASPPAASSEPASPPAEEAPPAEEVPPEAAPPAVVGVRPFDPSGDGENDDAAPRAIDDDPESFWNSSTYTTADFGGLKDGLGMVVALGDPSQVTGVSMSVNGSGGAAELRTSPDGGLEGSTVVADSRTGSGDIEFELEAPVEAEYLLLWWTELPETDAGFRIELAQVQVQ